MRTLTGAVLIAASGIFCLVALQTHDNGPQSIADVTAFLLGIIGVVFFIGGLFGDISSNQKDLRELVREISSKREDNDREHREVDVAFKRGG